MGCLTINVRKVPATTARVTADCRNHMDVAVACQNGMDVTARCKNSMVVDVQNRNTRISITAALVCMVSALDVYEYFYVTEGPLEVEEGYFKVKRII